MSFPLKTCSNAKQLCTGYATGVTPCCNIALCQSCWELWRDALAMICKCATLEESQKKISQKYEYMFSKVNNQPGTLMNSELKIVNIGDLTHINSW